MRTLRELADGVIVAGFDGTTIEEFQAAYPFPHGGENARKLAGYVLFARNTETFNQTRALNRALTTLYEGERLPVLAIDQEGGRVVRLHDGVVPIPAAQTLGERNNPDECRSVGAQVGGDLRRAGFTIDFAPVLDLAFHAENAAVGTRSFGSNPERVVALAGAFARGLRESGIASTYKHFPGHGSTALDSHFDLPVIDVPEATFRSRDLVPFLRLLPENVSCVMAGHLVVPAFDTNNPATLSRRILTGLLREEIGFTGVCFTDCMQMDAIAKGVGTLNAAPRAIKAGADCVVISRGLQEAFACADAIVQAVEHNVLQLSRLEEAFDRVSALRDSF